MEKTIERRNVRRGVFAAALVGTTALFLSGCGAYNYSGKGNEFVVYGKVVHAGKQSLTARVYDITEANGDAKGWFKPNTVHQIHDNCNCHGLWNGNKQYGEVLTEAGSVISPHQVAIDSCVEFEGKIRTNQEGKVAEDRPVYDVAQIIPCGPAA